MPVHKTSLILISLIVAVAAASAPAPAPHHHRHHKHHHRRGHHKHHIPANTALERICSSTDHPEVCVSSVSPLAGPGTPADAVSVLRLEIRASVEATKAAQATLADLIAKPGGTADVASALGVCKEVYSDALDNYSSAVEAIAARDVGTIKDILSSAISDYDTCDNSFEEAGKPSPMADAGKNLTMLCSNCLAIASLIN